MLVFGYVADENEIPKERTEAAGDGKDDGHPSAVSDEMMGRCRSGDGDPECVERGIRNVEKDNAENGPGRFEERVLLTIPHFEIPGLLDEPESEGGKQ